MNERKKVAILGATGMLGNALYARLRGSYDLALFVRDKKKIDLLEKLHGDASKHEVLEFDAQHLFREFLEKRGDSGLYGKDFFASLENMDYIINAAGVTIPYALQDVSFTFFLNGVFPHFLADRFGKRVIHITTDCVFNGKEGFPYSEHSRKSPVDIYGTSKSIGEPTSCLTFRTSIIGRELSGFTGLLEWFLAQRGKTIKGFANHYWNGITTNEFARLCDTVMTDPSIVSRSGLYHIFSTTVSKYDMLQAFREHFQVDCEIILETEQKLNRTLTTVYDLNSVLRVKPFQEMIREI